MRINYDGFEVEIPDGFYYLFHTWERLEPLTRRDNFSEGLKARVADPLWYLSRQWQMGELEAEDAGTLVHARIDYDTERVTGYRPGPDGTYSDIPASSYTINTDDGEKQISANKPLEVLVEQEKIPWDWRMRIRAGQQFERILREQATNEAGRNSALATLKESYGITAGDLDGIVDSSSRRLVKMVVGRALNGEKLWLERNTLRRNYKEITKEFLAWYEALFAQGSDLSNPSYQPHTLEHSFSVRTDRETELVSDHYRNGDLEWYSSNHKTQRRIPESDEASSPPSPDTPPLTPTRVSFGGMPELRWWAMENSNIDLGHMDVARAELIKNMFVDFALVHGDDWFQVPLSLPTGSLTLVHSITTTDVFGVTQTIRNGRVNDPDPLKRWDLFSLTKNGKPEENADRDYLYIPPSSGFREESEPVESVHFIRDEQANLVFAIEQISLNSWGKARSVAEHYQEEKRLADGGTETSENTTNAEEGATESESEESPPIELIYRLATEVPKNWIPYICERIETDPTRSQIFLVQARLPHVQENPLEEMAGADAEVRTQIVRDSIRVNEETITRAGVKVEVTKQRLRWIDGKTYVWQGRKVVTGRGEGSSGLAFDVVREGKGAVG